MGILNATIKYFLQKRISRIEAYKTDPFRAQEMLLNNLLVQGAKTEWGKLHQYASIKNGEQFSNLVPVSPYEALVPYIERMMRGEQQVLWNSEVRWFSKSSGTTNAKSKFIPVSKEALEESHYQGGKDLLTMYMVNHPESKMFDGLGLGIGGSLAPNPHLSDSFIGDVSAVIMANLPKWAEFVRTPSIEVALMDEWESKLEAIATGVISKDVTSISGVPTWTVVLLNDILARTGKQHLLEVWPNFEVFFHGAVAFDPYKEIFKKFFPGNKVLFYETYSASEGFFAFQDQPDQKDMLLMLDNGIYYEFIPLDDFTGNVTSSKTLRLDEVELGVNYALVISTNAGLWRYLIGDTIRFTSLQPFRIRISGRTKHFINAFGEELMIENAESAISKACEETGAILLNFTAAPVYFEGNSKGAHEWIIEFEKEPENKAQFTDRLDQHLKSSNSDYEAKRYKDLALGMPRIHMAPKGTFYLWLKGKGKLGGQNKVPRLSNSREYVEEILALIESQS
ncbi:MAG: GH3 auxin-responsive promoter family protein [Cytophagaceae bacterium]|nr:GH3 auxin-responsive promoter family protein [Cytophagaceae bacterium]